MVVGGCCGGVYGCAPTARAGAVPLACAKGGRALVAAQSALNAARRYD